MVEEVEKVVDHPAKVFQEQDCLVNKVWEIIQVLYLEKLSQIMKLGTQRP